MTTRLAFSVTATPRLHVGFGGNHYVVCAAREPLVSIAAFLGRSARSVYYRAEHKCWAIRVRRDKDKAKLKSVLGRGDKS